MSVVLVRRLTDCTGEDCRCSASKPPVIRPLHLLLWRIRGLIGEVAPSFVGAVQKGQGDEYWAMSCLFIDTPVD